MVLRLVISGIAGRVFVASGGDFSSAEVPMRRRPKSGCSDLGPDNGGGAVDGQDVGGDGEDLIRAVTLVIPYPPDRVQAGDGLLVRGLTVAGVVGEDPGQGLSAGGPPCGLICGQLRTSHDGAHPSKWFSCIRTTMCSMRGIVSVPGGSFVQTTASRPQGNASKAKWHRRPTHEFDGHPLPYPFLADHGPGSARGLFSRWR